MTEPVLELPDELRAELKDPLGRIYTDADELGREAGEPILSVGDVVTGHLIESGQTPAVALVDGKTEREAVTDEVAARIETQEFDRVVGANNPPATLSAELLAAMTTAVSVAPEQTTLVEVDGEEDLATLPAVLLAPDGASVVYGQPGEGMVLCAVDEELRAGVAETVGRLEGDHERFWALLELV